VNKWSSNHTDSATTVRLPFLSWPCHRFGVRIPNDDELGYASAMRREYMPTPEETYQKYLKKEATCEKSVSICIVVYIVV
jgi:hypothetical protein